MFSGFFGVGKTTAIASLLSRKPDTEKWAILVNEFGNVPVDQIVFKDNGSNVIISEIPGGCMCCVANIPMKTAIKEILSLTKPDRILIEPTGLGHPAGIFDELNDHPLNNELDIGSIICLVDPRFALDPRIQKVDIFNDQIHLADILIASKADLVSSKELKKFYSWAENLFPPKVIITHVSDGNIPLEYLDNKKHITHHSFVLGAHKNDALSTTLKVDKVSPRRPSRSVNESSGYIGSGWIFSETDIFDLKGLRNCLGPSGLFRGNNFQRIKGVFRVGQDWKLLDRVNDEISIKPVTYRRDSRLEIIIPKDSNISWDESEKKILACIK